MLLSKILFYGIVYPVSFLPLPVLYLTTDLGYFLLYFVFGYRKKVVRKNLKNAFPDLDDTAILKIERKFYHHLTDLMAEGIKNLSISKKELSKRMSVDNPEIMDTLHEKNKSVLLVSGHYNNWEFLITSQAFLFPQQAVGIGKPLTSKFWDKKLNELRGRFGMRIINHTNVSDKLTKWQKESLSILALADQSPGDSLKSYWMNFLHQPTAVLFGPELLANQYNMAVVFFHMKKVKRGHYSIHLDLITETPRELPYGTITEKHTSLLEDVICKQPEYWLWSHKRWKRELPENPEELRRKQQEGFEKKFRK